MAVVIKDTVLIPKDFKEEFEAYLVSISDITLGVNIIHTATLRTDERYLFYYEATCDSSRIAGETNEKIKQGASIYFGI